MTESRKTCIGDNLKYLRCYHGYTQEEVANKIHISRSSYATIELGRKIPRLDLLIALSEIFHIKADALFEPDAQKFIKEVTLASGADPELQELIEIYRQLSPFSQGCLFEKAASLLTEERKRGKSQCTE